MFSPNWISFESGIYCIELFLRDYSNDPRYLLPVGGYFCPSWTSTLTQIERIELQRIQNLIRHNSLPGLNTHLYHQFYSYNAADCDNVQNSGDQMFTIWNNTTLPIPIRQQEPQMIDNSWSDPFSLKFSLVPLILHTEHVSVHVFR